MHHQHQSRGTCLCGAVSIAATLKSSHLGACHCSICQKWGGGPFLAAESQGAVQLEGVENISVYASSEWAERGFCRQCGTHLFYRLKNKEVYAMPFSLFDPRDDWVLADQIFVEEKPAFYSFAEKTRNLTGAEVFAQHPDA